MQNLDSPSKSTISKWSFHKLPLVFSAFFSIFALALSIFTGNAPSGNFAQVLGVSALQSSASGLLSANPPSIQLCPPTTSGSTTLVWNTTSTDTYQLRQGTETGQLLTTSTGSGQITVSNISTNTNFYLRKSSYDWQYIRGRWVRVQVWTTVGQTTVTTNQTGCGSTGGTPNPPPTNVALSSQGATVTASSLYPDGRFTTASIIDGNRGTSWATPQHPGWADATNNQYPDWVEVKFSGPRSINKINVFTLQDNATLGQPITPTQTFTQWGIQDFKVEYKNQQGSWSLIPNGQVTNNNLVWREFSFLPVTTDSIKVTITKSLGGQWVYSRLQEVEALEVTKASFHRFEGLRAGLKQEGDSYVFDDFALGTIFNPFTQPVDITYKVIADNPNFKFTNGSTGVLTITRQEQNFGANIAGPEAFPFYVPFGSHFTGSVELTACVRGSSPCQPANFYAYILPHIEHVSSPDPSLSWFLGWDVWRANVPVVWDRDAGKYMVLYTNYWHNVHEWPKGWTSSITIKNTGSSTAVYTVKHFPKGYSQIAPAGGCNFSPMVEQSAQVTVSAGQTKVVDFRSLFGWSPDSAVFMEGYATVTPESPSQVASTVITSETVPISNTTASCLAPGIGSNIVSIKSPSAGATVSGSTVNLTARVALDRGIDITAVKFYVDGQLIGSGSKSSMLGFDSLLTWNSKSVGNGNHTLSVKVFNNESLITGSPVVGITVSN